MSLPDLSWIEDIASIDDISEENYVNFLREACCHFLTINSSIEFADIRFETTLRNGRGVHSGVIYKGDCKGTECEQKHNHFAKLAGCYSAMMRPEHAFKTGLGSCIEKLDSKGLLINVDCNSLEDKGYQIISSNKTCKGSCEFDISISCSSFKEGYHCIPPLKDIVKDINTKECPKLSDIYSDRLANLDKAISMFMTSTNGRGSLIYMPLRAHKSFHERYEIHGGLYLYNLSGKKITTSISELVYFHNLLYLLGTNQRIKLYYESEIEESVVNIDSNRWVELKVTNSSDIGPGHWLYGGKRFPSVKYCKSEVAESVDTYKEKIQSIINDIAGYDAYEWKKWQKPPIRALVQNECMGRDLLIFMHLLEKGLSRKYEKYLQISFKLALPRINNKVYSTELHLHSLWFNVVALGYAIDAICGGLSSLRDNGRQIVDENSKAKMIVEYGYNFSNSSSVLLCFEIYEELSPTQNTLNFEDMTANAHNPSQYEFRQVPYKSDCWKSSHNSLQSAREYLYKCGVRTLLYSGQDEGSGQPKTELICFKKNGDLKTEGLQISQYKKYPPFLFFGLPAVLNTYGNVTLISNNEVRLLKEHHANIIKLFKERYANNNS